MYRFAYKLIFFALLATTLCLPIASLAAPRIKVAQANYDFGTTNSEARIEHAFTISNTGDKPLNIHSVKCCCGAECSEVEKNLEPGAQTVLKVGLSLKNRKGSVTKRLYIRSNDPKCVILPLTIRGKVTKPN